LDIDDLITVLNIQSF